MVVWAEPGVVLDYPITRVFKSPYGYPGVCTHVWLEGCRSIEGPVLYLEPDAWPCCPDWYFKLKDEYAALGCPGAMVTADCHEPYDVVGGIGVYDLAKLTQISIDELLANFPAFDSWIGQLPDDTKKTALIRHSYAIYQNDQLVGFHYFASQENYDKHCKGAAIFHKDSFGSVQKWATKT